jgi:murein L,D-transpeptidase YafK
MRSLQPLSAQMVSEIEQRNMAKESPILVRIFKEESELEVWKQDKDGRYALLKTYPICRWSGELGPKVKEGDRQAPEGFYTITPSLMNPNSSYYLAINMGFPNAYDRANGRSGAFLMIHGDCSSRGCYAMTDEQIGEIYALARESFFGGQRAFQIQAMPFRMTPVNMAKHRNSPHMAFWRMLKQGYDHFEVTRQEPKIDVCDRRYVFDAEGNTKFSAAGKCPAITVNQDVMAAVQEKQQRDDRQTAELVSRGAATVPVRTGTDGGMHPTFLAAFQRPYSDSAGVIRSPFVSLPGTIPAHARPPGEPNSEAATGSVVAMPAAAPAQQQQTRVAAAQPTAQPAAQQTSQASTQASSSSGGLFGNLFSSSSKEPAPATKEQSGGMLDRVGRMVGLRGSEPAADTTPAAKPKAAPKATQTAAAKSGGQPKADAKPGAIPQQAKPATQEAAATPEPTKPSNSASLLNGAQPAVPTGSFDTRWGQFR